MKIALVISSMGLGGAQQILSWLANSLTKRGHEVSLLTFDQPGTPTFFELSPAVRLAKLGMQGTSSSILAGALANLKRVRVLRRCLLGWNPDVVLSFVDQMNVLTLFAVAGRIPVVVSERIHPALHHIGRVWSALRLASYSRSAVIVVQTEEIAQFFPARLRTRCRVLANPVLAPSGATGAHSLPRPLIVGMGRLHAQKGFDILLRAFAKLKDTHTGWHLRIFGEGPQQGELQRLSTELGLNGAHIFPGVTREPQAILANADIFVLPSRFEGFPNALCQALACGVPVVATDCPGGSKELIRQETDGLLVRAGDEDALAAGLERLMADSALRRDMARNAPDILRRYAPEAILDQWEKLLRQVAAKARCSRRQET